MAELSDTEVFGSTPASPTPMLSDADVFGTGTPSPKPATQMSDSQVFAPSNPGPIDLLGEVGKAVAHGYVSAGVTSPLQGLAGQIYEPDTSKPVPSPPPGGYKTEADVPELPILPVAQSTPYKLAQSIEGALPQDKGILNPVVRDVASGFGSVGANITMSMIPGLRAIALPTVVAQGAGEAAERAVNAGASEEQVRRAATLGNIAGATEFVDFMLPTFGTYGKMADVIGKIGARAVQGAFIEGGQEGVQQFIQNWIAKTGYKPQQSLAEDVAYNALIGGIVGGVAAPALHRGSPTSTAPTPETTAQSVAAPTVEPTMPQPGAPTVTTPDPSLVTPQEPVPTPSPTVEEVKAQTLSPQIVDHIQKQAPPLQVPEKQLSFDQLMNPAKADSLTDSDLMLALTKAGYPFSLLMPGTIARTKELVQSGLTIEEAAAKIASPSNMVSGPASLQDATVQLTSPVDNPDVHQFQVGNYVGNLITRLSPDGKTLDIPFIQATTPDGTLASANVFGPTVIRQVLQQLQNKFPTAERITGLRLTGANRDRTASVNLKEEIKSAPGANTARLAKLLGPKLYGEPTDLTPVSVKEMFQNSFDAVKASLEQGKDTEGNIDVNMDPRTRTVSVQDDGSGMTPQVLAKQFLEIAGTSKETKRASGGLGIAKMLFIFGNKALHVTTMRDGKVAELNTTGEQLFSALDDMTKAPNISVRTPTTQDLQMFPKGRGTRVEVRVPEQYQDPTTGEQKKIGFDIWDGAHPVLRNSPLFGAINVRFNGEELALGNHFPIEDYTQFTNAKFDWGMARIYIARNEAPAYSNHVHILSNGLWQFSTEIKKNPNDWMSDNVPREIYIDTNPKVNPEDAGYPFDLNRQQFSPTTKKDFENLTKYIGLLFQQQDFRNEAHNFGTMQFLDYDPTTKGVSASKTIQIEPKAPPPPDAVSLIPQGKIESVTVIDGELRVNGRKIPDLTPEVLEKFQINPASLRVDQSEIDPRRVILHDNVEILVSSSETRSVVDYGREKFGKRFDEYVFAMGNAFKELRDVVVRYMPAPIEFKATGDPLQQIPFGVTVEAGKVQNGYEALGKEGVGISFDQQYRGVSITVPFHGMFLNPVVPEYTDPVRAAVGMVGTMVHELAHHKVRSHDAEFPAEMQRILIMLDSTPSFNFHAFKQKVVNIVNGYHDVLTHMNGVFTSGDFLTRPRGKRFEDTSSGQEINAGLLADTTGPGGESKSGSRLAEWVAKGETISPSESGRAGAAYQTRPSGADRPSDNGRSANYNATRSVDPGISAPPQQPEVGVLRDTVQGAIGEVPPPIKEAASHADRINWMYKYLAGVTQLLDGNPYFRPLRNYVERVRQMHSDESKIHDAALRLLKDWRGLGATQMKALENLIFEVQDMPYLSQAEKSLDVGRHPTQAEFEALARKHKVDEEALKVYNRVRQMDETFLRLLEQEAKDAARRRLGNDPIKLAARIDEIEAVGRLARSTPFFPFTRFGRYYLTVKDQAGKVTHFETFEPARFVGITVKRAERYQQAKARELERRVPPGHTVETGVLPETAEPLIGLPTLLLQEMQNEGIQLTPNQIEAIKLMQSSRNPAMSLKRRATYNDSSITGHSLDLSRSFAKYFFHGGRYYAKTRHVWALRGHVAEAQVATGNKAGLIASYMGDHLQNTVLDARGDFGAFKGAIFLWAMGYVPAAATQNLTQTPMVTYPFLAGKFGDIRATKHVIKSILDVTNFYKKGSYVEPSPTTSLDFEMKSLGYGIKTGRISETQAPELAGLAGGGKLISGMGGNRFEQSAAKFQEKAAWAFEMAEQFNRRVTWRAALRLAMENPQAKFVDESVQKYQGEYKQLVAEFSSEAKARAVVSAIHSVDQTQFVYARYARSRLFRGPRNILFVFKQYISSLLWMLGNNKADVLPRWLVVTMLMGGLGGVPGYDDMKSIFRALGIWFFGKDANIDKLIRDYTLQWSNGTVAPDLILHGLSRKGFGLPALVDMMGSLFTGQQGRGLVAPGFQHSTNVPYPVLDRSRAIGAGNILPIDVGKIFTPTDKLDKTIADETQRSSGAVFSVGFNIYKAIMDRDNPAGDYKRWEKAMPRALSSVSRSYRAFSEGRERSGKGGPNSASTIVPYDTRDTEQMLEALALAGGYQPLRQQAKWDLIMAQAESSAFYDMRKKDLLEEYFEALKGKDPKEIVGVRDAIIKYNRELPDYAKPNSISADTIQKSMIARERSVVSRETGVPVQKSKIGIAREMQRLFPEATIDVRRVR